MDINNGDETKRKSCASTTKKGSQSANFVAGEPIVFTWGRMDTGECECRSQTLTIDPDGTYKVVSIHHNHSAQQGSDDGGRQGLSYTIRAGEYLVETFGGSRIISKQ